MFPQTCGIPLGLIAQPLARLAPNQAFTFTGIGNHDDTEFGVDTARTVPVTTSRTNFYFGGNNQFLAHDQLLAKFNENWSDSITNGSIEGFI